MVEFTIVETAATPYLYVTGSCGMDPAEISEAMGAAFGTVTAFMKERGIAPAGPPLSVYHDYDPDSMRFRAGVIVARSDLGRASGQVAGDVTPAGRALHFIHVGPYRTLREDYELMMAHLHTEGLTLGRPSWEVYVDAPDTVPEDKLRTEVYCALA